MRSEALVAVTVDPNLFKSRSTAVILARGSWFGGWVFLS